MVGTQALLLTGSDVGLDHVLNLGKMWTSFSPNLLICKVKVTSTLPADLLPKLEYMGSIPQCLHIASAQ